MKITICDFCGKKVDSQGVRFEYKGKTYTIDISIIQDKNGVRACHADFCPVYTIKYAITAAKTILKTKKF